MDDWVLTIHRNTVNPARKRTTYRFSFFMSAIQFLGDLQESDISKIELERIIDGK